MSDTSLTFISDEYLSEYLNENTFENAEHAYLTFRANTERSADFEALSRLEQEKVLNFAERAIEKYFAQFGRDTKTLSAVEKYSTPQEAYNHEIFPFIDNKFTRYYDYNNEMLTRLVTCTSSHTLDDNGKIHDGKVYWYLDPTVDLSYEIGKAHNVPDRDTWIEFNLEDMAHDLYPLAMQYKNVMKEFQRLEGKDALNVVVNFEKGKLDGDLYRTEGATPQERFGNYLINNDIAHFFLSRSQINMLTPQQIGANVAESNGYVLEEHGYYQADYKSAMTEYSLEELEEIITAAYDKHESALDVTEGLSEHLNDLGSISEEMNQQEHVRSETEQVR